ncbi:MAG TPA: hypothetical protein DCY79_10425 [Planctomycetaceae bacterium]|nr:hypothetical protein [Blastopirellula sp.]HAY80208.1 hypothetical protein [Planctomycetaceae bacterium]|tara:strand:- start:516 stop:1817 length:1302 start_codon:yes stop_codon:yes gene_type:complete
MRHLTTTGIRHWLAVGMVVVIVVLVAFWFFSGERLPRKVRLATGESGGLYNLVGKKVAAALNQRIDREVVPVATAGSRANFQMLFDGEAELAIVQGGTLDIQEVSVVTSLYPEYVMVIVRRGRGIEAIADLFGKNVAIGRQGSGNRQSALAVLEHFDIELDSLGKKDLYFKLLLDDPTLDGAIVTTGVANPDLEALLQTGQFDLLSLPSAPAIDMISPFFQKTEIPRGLFAPNVPSEPVPTIATTAYLVARSDANALLVQGALEAVHEESLRLDVPTLIPRQETTQWVSTRLHPVAQRYFYPSDNIGMMANVMESLAATKELLFAIGAGVFLLWHRWRRFEQQERDEAVSVQKERLDVFLEKTLRIETRQLKCDDPQQLQKFLDEVTKIKLAALQEFTEEELRGDQAFSIFMTQSANLVTTLQLKILSAREKA